jgi:hypothetical protein
MSKRFLGLIAVSVLVASSPIHAQDAFHLRSPAESSARIGVRMAIAKAALQLTPDQTQYWPAVEEAIRSSAQARYARIAAVEERLHQPHEVDPIELFRARANALEQRAVELKKVVDAWEPLYRSLTREQKERMSFLAERVVPALRLAIESGRAAGFNEGASGQPWTGGTVGISPR